MSTKLVVGTPDRPVRFSYAHVWEKTKMPGDPDDKAKYAVTLLISKSDEATVAAIEDAMYAEEELAKKEKWGGRVPAGYDIKVLRDGDDSPREEYKGHWYIVCKSLDQPGIVARNGQAIIDKRDFYSGCYGIASVQFYGYNKPSNGMAVAISHVMKTADGESFSGRESAEDAFKDFIKPEGFDALGDGGRRSRVDLSKRNGRSALD